MTENKNTYNPFEEIAPLLAALDDKQGAEIKAIDLRDFSTIADVFVLVTANSNTHMGALQDIAEETLEKMAVRCRLEGRESTRWRLVDGGHIVVHIFSDSGREFYRLERIWGGAPSMEYGIRE